MYSEFSTGLWWWKLLWLLKQKAVFSTTRHNTVPTQPNTTLYSLIKNVHWAWTQHGTIPGVDCVRKEGLHFTVLGLQSTFGITIEMSVFWRGLTPVSLPMYSINDFRLKNSPKESILQQASGSCKTHYWLLMAWIRIHRRYNHHVASV